MKYFIILVVLMIAIPCHSENLAMDYCTTLLDNIQEATNELEKASNKKNVESELRLLIFHYENKLKLVSMMFQIEINTLKGYNGSEREKSQELIAKMIERAFFVKGKADETIKNKCKLHLIEAPKFKQTLRIEYKWIRGLER